MWIELKHRAEDWSVHPVGVELRVNVTALCSCYWTVDYVWIRNLTYNNIEQLKFAYNSDQTIKEQLHRYLLSVTLTLTLTLLC